MPECLLCKTKLTDIKVTVTQKYQIEKSSKVPFGWLYLSPEETDPKLVNIYQIPLPKERTGQAVCNNCGASCELVGINEDEFIVVSANRE